MRLCRPRSGPSRRPGSGPSKGGVKRQKLEAFVQVSLHDGCLRATLDTAAQAEATVLDGCYVLETDVPQTALAAQAVHDRYRDLHAVEQDFRTMKTGL